MISVVLSTRNRAPFLAATVASYERITTAVPWELIVIDNGSTDDTRATLERLTAHLPFRLRVITEPRPGLSRARNAGWRGSTGDIVVFTDDDCYPASDFVDQVARNFENPGLGYLGGRVLLHDPADLPLTIQTRDTRLDIPPGRFLVPGVVHGANMAIRRGVFEAIGGFDELLGAGTPYPSEDADFLCRASAAGFAGAYDPGPVVSHHHRRRTRDEASQLLRGYDLGRGAYYAACLLDPRRRRLAAVEWYWNVRKRVTGDRGATHERGQTWRELRGAIGYLGARARRRMRAPA